MEKIHSAVGSGCKADFQWVQACSRNPKKILFIQDSCSSKLAKMLRVSDADLKMSPVSFCFFFPLVQRDKIAGYMIHNSHGTAEDREVSGPALILIQLMR